jgi:putative uncharacterized protein (fragment)
MYYISYATSALSSLDLWIKASDDRESAINTYKSLIDCGAYTPYIESIESCGLRNIFEPGVVSEIAEETELVLKDGTLKSDEEETSAEITEPSEETETANTVTSTIKNKAKTKGMAIPMLFSLIVILFVLAIFIMIIILITSIIKHKKNKKQ